MKTVSKVHSQAERIQIREAGERRALRTQVRLLTCVSIMRTVVTRILPLCGSAGWWMAAACMIPALCVYALCRWAMYRTHTNMLTDCVRSLLGTWGVWLLSILLAVMLLWDGASSMTVLITMFTEGIGSEGTQTTMAVLTAAALLMCLNREGLSRGAYFLRWPILAVIAIAGINLLSLGSWNHLFPWMGNGNASVWATLRAGMSLGWPLILLLMMEPVVPGQSRILDGFLPAGFCALLCLFIVWAIPCELLVSHPALADSLLLPVVFLSPMVKILAYSLWMLVLFLQIGSAARIGADYILAPTGRELRWLAGILVIALAATQTVNTGGLWHILGLVEPWLLTPLALLSIILMGMSIFVKRGRQKA